MKKLLILAVIIVASGMIGCSLEHNSTPPPTAALDKIEDYIIYIYTSAKNDGGTMPFWGETDLWVSSSPITSKPERSPDMYVVYGPDDDDPVELAYPHDYSYYLFWYSYQIVNPPNGGWETQTEYHQGYVQAGYDYYGYCVFEQQ